MGKLTEETKHMLINNFNNFKKNSEPSYENFIHKKVYDYDIILTIPKGKKCFLWFTVYKNQNVCLVYELSDNYEKNKKIENVSFLTLSFGETLSYGTIFYGTIFYKYKDSKKYISLEDIFYYKCINCIFFNFDKKLEIFKLFFENDILQYNFNNNGAIIGLPLMSSNLKEIFETVKTKKLNYEIKHICYRFYGCPKKCLFSDFFLENSQHKRCNSINNINAKTKHKYSDNINNNINNNNYFNGNKTKINNNPKIKIKDTVFIVKPDIKTDIYNLFYFDNKEEKEIFYDIAYIPDYETSVMMNNLFRNIKENNNLDLLEESDDEEEFENTNVDKYVYLNKKYKMLCYYHLKFKKYVPKHIVD